MGNAPTTDHTASATVASTMTAIRLHEPGNLTDLVLEEIATPELEAGDALVRVHAAAITRDELEWPVDRLPAIPSYELSGVVAAVAPDVHDVEAREAVYALTAFDHDGAAAEYAVVRSRVLAPKPLSVGHVESAALPLAALSAWQGLFDHGRLEAGQRVLVLGAAGGVGHLATQLARWRGAYVIGTASQAGIEHARGFGSHEVLDHTAAPLEEIEPVDLVFDTVGGDPLARAGFALRAGGRLVSVAEEPSAAHSGNGIETSYFVVEPNREQLIEIARLVDSGDLRPAIDSVFVLAEAGEAFARSMSRGKRGKVVVRVVGE